VRGENGLPTKTFQVQFVAEPAEFPTGSPCRSSEDVQRVARSIYDTLDADKEHFVLPALNNKNRVNGFKVISTRSLTASLFHPREVWRAAVAPLYCWSCFRTQPPEWRTCAESRGHRHHTAPQETGDMLGIRVLDHVVLGLNRFYSFSDQGLI
jgi:DNA repair protein RadC